MPGFHEPAALHLGEIDGLFRTECVHEVQYVSAIMRNVGVGGPSADTLST